MKRDGCQLAFIIGHYKSGSTWLLNVLSLHPDICGMRETHIFRHANHAADIERATAILFSSVPWSAGRSKNLPLRRLREWLQPILEARGSDRWFAMEDRPLSALDLSVRQRRALRDALSKSSSAEDYCLRFFAFHMDLFAPRRYLLEKTPTNVEYVSYIRDLFPKCKLIAIHRDGRDVVVSDQFFQTEVQGAIHWDFEAAVNAWREAMLAQRQAAAEHEIFSVSYEELHSDPTGTLRRLLGQLGLPASDDLVDDMLNLSSFRFRTGRDSGQESRRSFDRKGVVGDWRNHFTDEQKERFKRIAGDLLIELGYERDHGW